MAMARKNSWVCSAEEISSYITNSIKTWHNISTFIQSLHPCMDTQSTHYNQKCRLH